MAGAFAAGVVQADAVKLKEVCTSRPPNILLILTDQQRADTIAALGNPIIRTPALDRLVREGTTFTNCYTPSPVCCSARCSLVTGLLPHRTGCVDNMPMPVRRSFMEALRDAGYQTHGVGKMHFTPDARRMWGFESRDLSEEMPDGDDDDYLNEVRRAGYAHVSEPLGLRSEYYYIPQPSQLPPHLNNTAWVAERSIDFLRRRDHSRPFLLWTSFIRPHPPFESPAPWNRLYRCGEMPAPFRPDRFEHLLTYWNRRQNRYKYRDAGHDLMLERTLRAAYYGCISFIDYHIGRILDALGPEVDDTLIVFTSDHGEMLGDYGSFGKRCMLNRAVKVPLIVRWPGAFTAGAKVETPASLVDLYPTFLDAAGLPASEQLDGVPLRSLLEQSSPRDAVISQFQQGPLGLYMIGTRRWKYIYSAADQREILLDVQNDPQETRDLASSADAAQVLAQMRGRLIERFQRDHYHLPLDGENWRAWPRQEIPADPLRGLLLQDPPDLEEQIRALGEYARPPAEVVIDQTFPLRYDGGER